MCGGVFDKVEALVVNFRQSIVNEQKAADVRRQKEIKWCKKHIAAARKLLARRQADVDALKKHIKWLENEKKEAEKDRKLRQERIKSNIALIKKFKKERCDSNLLFVKNLREHMEAIEVLSLLRGDIVNYFNKKTKHAKGKGHKGKGKHPKVNHAFLERFSEFSHLLDEEKKMVLVELTKHVKKLKKHKHMSDKRAKKILHASKKTNAQRKRTAKQVGKEHIDNKRGALKRLKTPKWVKKALYFKRLRKKILGMIDHLIKHLQDSKEVLTRHEIRAAEDFAKFQFNTLKENKHLARTIIRLTKKIAELTERIRVAKAQLVKRIKLRDQARAALNKLIRICKEKKEYYIAETKRRTHELHCVDAAKKIFDTVLKKISARIRARTNRNVSGKAYTKKNALHTRVVNAKSGVKKRLQTRKHVRNEVVF